MTKQNQVFQDPHVPVEACLALYQIDRSSPTNTAIYTAEWLEAHWGKPATVSSPVGDEVNAVWTYKFGPVWDGILPVVVVPIPIALPLEREQVRFVLRDGRVISATQSTRHTVGGAFGFAVGPCGAHVGPFSLEGFFE